MRKKTVGTYIAASAVLAILAASPAHAATLQVKEPELSQPHAAGDQRSARIIVRYKDAATRDRSMKIDVVQSAALRASLDTTPRRDNAAATPLRAEHLRTLAVGADVLRLSRSLEPAELSRLLAEIKADPSVKYAEVDVMDTRAATPDDPFYAQYQWHFHDPVGGINLPVAWDIGQGEGVVVAVLDTGLVPTHPDVNGQLLAGYDFITDPFVSRRATADRVPGALDYGDWNDDPVECDVSDSSWHGTHVAGTVGEATGNGVGMAGVAYRAIVLPVRVLGRCGGYRSDIADAMVWASGGSVPGVPDNPDPAEVINMSLGGSGACPAVYQDAVDSVVARGTAVVVAAGNSAANAANHSPASCANVISVGATRSTGGITSYSNYGAVVDIAAPGGGGSVDGSPRGYVWQHWHNAPTTPESGTPSYIGMGGTSMAAPHVAGVVALVQGALIAANRDPLAPSAMELLLKQTARAFPVTIPSGRPIGAGIVNARAALDRALEDSCTENCGATATPLLNRVPVAGLGGYAGQQTLYSFEAKAGAVLSVLTYGGTGNVSLYGSFGREPTPASHDAKSTRPGNNETLRFTAPKAGTYYIKLVGEGAYGGLTLEARQ